MVLLSEVTLSAVGTYAKLFMLYNSDIASFSTYVWLGKLFQAETEKEETINSVPV